MIDVDAEYKELCAYIKELAVKFIDKHLPADPSIEPSAYAHDVKAFCVLSHAAFEEFIEQVVLAVSSHAVDRWLARKRVNDVILALLSWHGAKLKIDDDEGSPETKPFDYLRPLIVEAKAEFSRKVHNNNGISIFYLRGLLIPVAIEIKQDVNLLNSLQKLAEGRGTYAHKGRVKTVLAPEDARRHVQDVLDLCDDIRAKALANMA
jgi:hypothetical protein